MSLDKEKLREQLNTLLMEHRDLDEAILRLTETPVHDMIALQRMKKRKLAIRDMILKLESMLIDDIIA